MSFPSQFGHECIFMLVYGSLVVCGMVLSSYDSGFKPSLSFFYMSWYVGMFILVLSFGLLDEFQNLGQMWSQGSFPKA